MVRRMFPTLSAVFAIALFLLVIPVRWVYGEDECLSPADKQKFMQMFEDIVDKGHTERLGEIKDFLRSRGCAKELDEAERQAREILKGAGVQGVQ
jgi:hypothetical protein